MDELEIKIVLSYKDDMLIPQKPFFVCNWKVHLLTWHCNLKKSMSNSFRELIWGISV